jgi:hypothetical protein
MRRLNTGAENYCGRNSTRRPNFLWGVMIGLAVIGLILVVV